MSLQRLICDGSAPLVHLNEPCSRELGRVRGVILFDASFDINAIITNLQAGTDAAAAVVVGLISAGINNGTVHIINKTKGSYNGGEPNTVDGYGDEETRLLWYNHNLQFEDPTYEGNRDFWLQAQKSLRYVAWRTETLLHFSSVPANVLVTAPVEDSLNSAVTWHVGMTWKSKELPVVVPVGIFDKILMYGGVPNIFTSEYTKQYV